MFSQLNCPPRLCPCLRFTASLTVAAQDSGPSGSLILSRKNFAFSASCRLTPAHKNRRYIQNPSIPAEFPVQSALPQHESQRGKLDTEPLVLAAMAGREYCL